MSQKTPPPTRLHKATAIIGRKGTGKSTYANKLALAYIAANPTKKVLIFDVNGSPAYAEHEPITYGRWHEFTCGVRKLYDSDHERAMKFLSVNFRGGMIIFEDCTKYIDAHPKKEVKTMLVDHRMMHTDLVFTFHSVGFVPPFFWKMLNYISLGKTDDDFTNRRSYWLTKGIPNVLQVISKGISLVKNKNDYHREMIETNI
jgi:hypothetical protein